MKNKKLFSHIIFILVTVFVNVSFVCTTYAQTQLNLIQNPSVEVGVGNSPSLWLQAGFGTNNRTFSYPVSGFGSGSALNVSISTYTDGDAKWYFAEVPVIPARSYIYTDNYISNTPTQIVAEYFDANHVHLSYAGFITVPVSPVSPANSWGSVSTTFIPPAGAAFVTVYHLLNSVGSLTTDNFSLTEVPLPVPFDKGYVSLTFDDGFLSQYQNALPILNSSNIKGVFYMVSHAISGLSIKNSSLENSTLNIPNDWTSLGIANATYTYPVPGHTGVGAQVSSTDINTNAAWRFNPISVINDSVYSFSEWYKSTTNSELVALITKTDGTTTQADITDVLGNTINGNSLSLASTDNNWTEVKAYFYLPLDTKSVTIFNQLKGIGDLTIDDVTFGEPNYIDLNQVKSLFTDGQEIGGHTQSHKDLSSLSSSDAQTEITGGLNDLLNNGVSSVLSFDYPYGTYNSSVQKIVGDSGFTSGRTVAPGFNGKDTDKFALLAQSVNADTTLATVQSWINQAVADHTWLILVFHEIQSDLTNSPYGTTPANLQSIIDYIKTSNITTQTIREGINLMNSTIVPPPAEVTLSSIAITKPANKLNFTVGDLLDISGLVVTGTYSDNSTKIETITSANISDFNSITPATGQVLTVTVGGKTTTYTINIVASPSSSGGSSNNGGHNSSGTYLNHKNESQSPKHEDPKGKVLGAERYKFNKDLKFGMKNNSVKELQAKLKKEGMYDGDITGYFGPLTLVLVKKYQTQNKLPRTGYVGPRTRDVLNTI